jgi:hypothetical protein
MDEEPLLRVVRGIPTPEELAALFGALASLSSPADGPAPRPSMSAWVRSARPAAGRPSWRASGLPS